MIRKILVPVSGTQSDEFVFATALALAERQGAHLDFHHVRLSVTEAALHAPHMSFCIGRGLTKAIDLLDRTVETLSARAAGHVDKFCSDYGISLGGPPTEDGEVTASWSEGADRDNEDLLKRARHADLTVLARARHTDYMPPDLVEALLLNSGRPVVLAPEEVSPPPAIDTVVVGWKEVPATARALAAALPLLQKARRVIVAGVRESGNDAETLGEVAQHLDRHGVAAETRLIENPRQPIADLLLRAAAEFHADLLVLGAFSRRPLTERIFGGVTRSLLETAPLPVFLLH